MVSSIVLMKKNSQVADQDRRWSKVNTKLDVPLNAMMLSMIVQLLLAFIYFGSTAAFNAFSGVGVITLTLSYAVPILASVMDGRKQIKEGSFYLGALGVFANWVAISKASQQICIAFLTISIVWSALVIPLFCMPTFLPVTLETMNYASVVFAGFVAIATGWYFIWGKKNYQGPPTQSDAVLEARRASVVSHTGDKL